MPGVTKMNKMDQYQKHFRGNASWMWCCINAYRERTENTPVFLAGVISDMVILLRQADGEREEK